MGKREKGPESFRAEKLYEGNLQGTGSLSKEDQGGGTGLHQNPRPHMQHLNRQSPSPKTSLPLSSSFLLSLISPFPQPRKTVSPTSTFFVKSLFSHPTQLRHSLLGLSCTSQFLRKASPDASGQAGALHTHSSVPSHLKIISGVLHGFMLYA